MGQVEGGDVQYAMIEEGAMLARKEACDRQGMMSKEHGGAVSQDRANVAGHV